MAKEKDQQEYILVLNCGSATLKFELFDVDDLKSELEGGLERIGLKKSFLAIQGEQYKSKVIFNYPKGVKNHMEAVKLCFDGFKTCGYDLASIIAVGHRVVHGGEEFTKPIVVNKKNLVKIAKYNKLAPLHNPNNLAGIKAAMSFLHKIKQIAVFDTAFYRTLPDYVKFYALPIKYYEQYKIRRYGFHGISHSYVANQAAEALRKPLSRLKLVTCHLGSGCSITAIKNGKAIDTSMGFTPLEGLLMGTRSGSIDPAIVLYLIEELKIKPAEVKEILQKKSGFEGIAGTSDVREVLIAAGYRVPGFLVKKRFSKEDRQRARLALKMFVYQIQKYIASYANALGSLDAVVFTAGIGERNFTIRRMILRGLKMLKDKKFRTLVIPTDEELAIAQEVKKLI